MASVFCFFKAIVLAEEYSILKVISSWKEYGLITFCFYNINCQNDWIRNLKIE